LAKRTVWGLGIAKWFKKIKITRLSCI